MNKLTKNEQEYLEYVLESFSPYPDENKKVFLKECKLLESIRKKLKS